MAPLVKTGVSAPRPFSDPRSVLRRHGLWAKKRFGQNFLVAASLPDRIAIAGGANGQDTAFEIGPGCGTLTHAVARLAGRVVALEHDRDLVAVAQSELGYADHVEIREGNVLDIDWSELATELGEAPVVYGNLPYHLSTPVLVGLLESRDAWQRACLLLQLEFATRVATPPGQPGCGTLSALAALWAEPRLLFRVAPSAFHPRPKVRSAVLLLTPRARPAVEVGCTQRYRSIVRALFAQRRKMARNTMRSVTSEPERILETVGIDPRRRGETFTIEELASISRLLSAEPLRKEL